MIMSELKAYLRNDDKFIRRKIVMDRIFIEEVKYDCECGTAPCFGPSVTTISIKYKNIDESFKWITVSSFDGILSFYRSDNDIFDKIIAFSDMSEEDEGYDEIWNNLNEEYLTEFEGIELTNDEYLEYYDSVLSEMKEDNYAAMLLKYAIFICKSPADKVDDIINAAKGKYIDDVQLL